MRPSPSTIAAAASGPAWSSSTIARESQLTACSACSTREGGSRSSARRLEKRRGDVVDGRQPLVGGVLVCPTVKFKRVVTASEGERTTPLCVLEQSVQEHGVCCRRQDVDHVDRDAEGGAWGNGGRQHGDGPSDLRIQSTLRRGLSTARG